MNYKLIALAVLSSSTLYAHTTFFAPYDGPFPVSIDSRTDGIVWRHQNCFPEVEDRLNWNFKGYVRYNHGIFMKLGTSLILSRVPRFDKHFERAGVDLQFGKYWQGYGAFRIGLFYDGFGVGGDYWAIYKDRFKWLTTLELATNKVHGGFHHDSTKLLVKWLNRFFVYGGIYISAGINHLTGSRHFDTSLTQGFIGFGAAI